MNTLIIAYDFSDDKTRSQFSKFLERYGRRIQYSVFEIKNSERILHNILLEIKECYEKKFTNEDSILIFHLKNAKVYRFGYSKNEEDDFLVM